MRAVGLVVIVPVMLMLLAALVRASQRVSQPDPTTPRTGEEVSLSR
jgi:hypothetical protein